MGDFMKVLIAYDGSDFSEAAVADLAYAGLPNDTEARIFRVAERHIDPGAESSAEDACIRLQAKFRSWNVQMETATGDAAEMILRRARQWPADLIVIGTHGRAGLKRLVLGSVSTAVTRNASCSVRIARSVDRGPTGIRLILAHDGSPQADAMVDAVCSRSWPKGTEARVVSVIQTLVATRADQMAGIAGTVSDINMEERHWMDVLGEESDRKLAQAGIHASRHVAEGDPMTTLVNEARDWNCDAIFMGARSRGTVERLLVGSVSSSVITHAPCTVEIVRSFKS
jgi:nucleotide-binding universal stress UspA family protein